MGKLSPGSANLPKAKDRPEDESEPRFVTPQIPGSARKHPTAPNSLFQEVHMVLSRRVQSQLDTTLEFSWRRKMPPWKRSTQGKDISWEQLPQDQGGPLGDLGAGRQNRVRASSRVTSGSRGLPLLHGEREQQQGFWAGDRDRGRADNNSIHLHQWLRHLEKVLQGLRDDGVDDLQLKEGLHS